MVYDAKQFERFVEMCGGSRYAATTFVAKEARKLANQYNNVISHAEALSWIISGKPPKIISNYKKVLKIREKGSLNVAYNMLSNVQDEEVKESVLESIRRSNKADHLIYVYIDVYDEHRQSRIRILTRMIWDEMKTNSTSY